MLRGFGARSTGTVLTSFSALTALCQRRAFAFQCSPLLRSSSSGGNSGNAGNKSAAEEDREELERERRLREQFAQKIQQNMPNMGTGGGSQQQQQMPNFGGFPGAPGMGGGFPVRTPMQQFIRLTFFLMALVMLMSLSSMANRNSPVYTMQGLPWWELPITSAAYFLLLRTLYPSKEQRRIKEEFEGAARENPRLTFDQFMAHRYPNMFDGYRASQAEAVAAVAAVLASATDLNFAKTMVRAAGRAKDTRASTDDVLDALRRDFPQIF